ncbi:MAG: hypothetical protein WBP38_12205 [Hyphomicrobium sp.]
MASALPPDKLGVALSGVTAWRMSPDEPVACPLCDAYGLKIVDQSVRPYSEWYALSCPACGLEHTLHIPLAPPM